MKKFKSMNMAKKLGISLVLLLVLGLGLLWMVVNIKMQDTMKKTTVARLKEATDAREVIINQYLDNIDLYFEDYGQSQIIRDYLKDPNNQDLYQKVVNYTKNYAATNDKLEGLFVTDKDNLVKYHTNEGAIGSYTKKDEAERKTFLEKMFASKDIFNVGITVSTSTGKQVVAEYYPIYDENNQPLGLVGGGVNADKLMSILDGMKLDGLNNSECLMIDVNKLSYVFCNDADMIGQQVDDDDYLDIINKVKNNNNSDTSIYEFRDVHTKDDVMAVYKYMPDKGYLFIIRDSENEIYAAVSQMASVLLVICIVVLLIITAISILIVMMIARDLKAVGNTIKEIGKLDLTHTEELVRFKDRDDEVGKIAKATQTLAESMKDAISHISMKSEQLHETSKKLADASGQTLSSITQVDTAVQEIAQGASDQATETQNASSSVLEIGEQIDQTAKQADSLHSNADNMMKCSKEVVDVLSELNDINVKAKEAIDVIYEQTNTTNDSAMKIREAANIITSISEETNLLSLNASIEAARAGEQGRGFAVVATQIQKLAEQSNNSAMQIETIINMLVSDSEKAVSTMEDVKEIMQQQNTYMDKTEKIFNDVKTGIDESIKGVNDISGKVIQMDNSKSNVVDVVQNLSAIAEENAASAEETSASTTVVNELMDDISKSATELSAIAQDVQESVAIFKIK